jgi:hypothetical protein
VGKLTTCISFIHLISLPSSFCISPGSFLSLSHFAMSIPHVLNSLFPHSTFCTFFLILPSNTCFLSSPSFFFLCPFSPQVLRSFLCHTPLMLSVVSAFFGSFPSFLLVCVFVPFTQLYIHPSSFCSKSFHFFTGIPVSLTISLSPSTPCFFFSCTFPFY